MTFERRDPDDPDVPREPTESDVDAAFAEIVAGWEAEARPRWPDDAAVDRAQDDGGSDPETEEIPTAGMAEAPVDELDDDDDHFVPPEPPPLPRPQPATVGAVALFAVGLVLLTVPGVLALSDQYGLPLGLLSITGAIVWLVARLRQGPPTDSGWDDGARL